MEFEYKILTYKNTLLSFQRVQQQMINKLLIYYNDNDAENIDKMLFKINELNMEASIVDNSMDMLIKIIDDNIVLMDKT